MKEKYSAVILALIAGGLGLHKFYLGKTTAGILYAVFFWTGIPAIMAFIDAICYLFMDKTEFDARYNVTKAAENGNNVDKVSEQVHSSLLEAKKLFEAGALTEEEFLDLKTKVLGDIK